VNAKTVEVEHIEKIVGLQVNELLEIKRKLAFLGLELSDILEFLDRDKVVLFAEQQSEITYLKRKIQTIKDALSEAMK